MSRFAEVDNDMSAKEQAEWDREVRAEWKSCRGDLKNFLRFLDAMPSKTIIADRFMRPSTGEVCAVAAFCRSKGMPEEDLRKTEAKSRRQRLDYDGAEECDGWEGPTIGAGVSMGLTQSVAAELGWKNDEVWANVYVPTECEMIETSYGRKRCKHYGVHGDHYKIEPMTDEERWLKLRNFIARKVGARPKPLPERLRIDEEFRTYKRGLKSA